MLEYVTENILHVNILLLEREPQERYDLLFFKLSEVAPVNCKLYEFQDWNMGRIASMLMVEGKMVLAHYSLPLLVIEQRRHLSRQVY